MECENDTDSSDDVFIDYVNSEYSGISISMDMPNVLSICSLIVTICQYLDYK